MNRLLLLISVSLLVTVMPVSAVCSDVPDFIISGIVKDRASHKRLDGVSVTLPGSNIGTVTNNDGYFSLTVPDSVDAIMVKAELIGYRTALTQLDYTGKDLTITMSPTDKMLDEVTVTWTDPRALIEKAIERIPQNYPSGHIMFTSFYRETIQKGRRHIGMSEAIINVLKTPYKVRNIAGERVKLVKGRRLMSQKKSDTLAVKIAGGPKLPIIMDIVKNDNFLFSPDELDFYNFTMGAPAEIDGRRHYTVNFAPRVKAAYALHRGHLYIDCVNLSITRAEFKLDMSDRDKATQAILFRKPRGLRFKPQEVEFTVAYKQQDGMTYLNYVRTVTRFNCDWKRRLFSSGYKAYAEMIMVDRDDTPQSHITRGDAFGDRQLFYDEVDNFLDPDFWKGYTIIEPTESLEKAVSRLSR